MDMSHQSEYFQKCQCGRTFSLDGAFSNHLRTCKQTMKRLFDARSKVRDLGHGRKRRRIHVTEDKLEDVFDDNLNDDPINRIPIGTVSLIYTE